MSPAGSESDRGAERGFTLLEVLVALIIFGIAFGAIAGIFQTALRQATSAETLQEARALAEQQMALLGTETPLDLDERTGVSATGLAWRTSVTLAEPIEEGDDAALYRVTVDVGTPESEQRYVTLTTLRLKSLR